MLLYNLFIAVYHLGISIAALRNKKAAQWLAGRRTLWTDLEQTFSKPHDVIWIHSASAGEFEQAKPVIEALKQSFPHYKILVTAFSPSGYPGMKKFALAEYVFYMPLDTARNANRFLNTIQPRLVLFIKYDFWYHHLKAVHERNIPLLLVSSLFRKEQPFFKSYGRFYLHMLRYFTQLFVQDNDSYELLKKFGIHNVTVAGDTRFDRVLAIANQAQAIPVIETFIGGRKAIIAGSTWPDDEKALHGVLKNLENIKWVIAPHEVNDDHIKAVSQLFQTSILFSSVKDLEHHVLQKAVQDATVLIIDTIGLLSKVYKYATIAYIGGGFTKSGIHNTLEAAVFGKPVLFGPNYQKFREARALIAAGGAFHFSTESGLDELIKNLLVDETALHKSSRAAQAYVQKNGGATEKIIWYIQENRLLTN